jgi:uncharacterized protein YdhG (YjbR/CyaY superfamily)
MKSDVGPVTVDQYIEGFPRQVQRKLQSIRSLVRRLAPEAQEKISYRMPAFSLNGNLVYFAAFRNHIGLFPTASGVSAFAKELAKYEHGRGSIQFPIDEPLPMELIERIVKRRVEENRAKGSGPGRRTGPARRPRAGDARAGG